MLSRTCARRAESGINRILQALYPNRSIPLHSLKSRRGAGLTRSGSRSQSLLTRFMKGFKRLFKCNVRTKHQLAASRPLHSEAPVRTFARKICVHTHAVTCTHIYPPLYLTPLHTHTHCPPTHTHTHTCCTYIYIYICNVFMTTNTHTNNTYIYIYICNVFMATNMLTHIQTAPSVVIY